MSVPPPKRGKFIFDHTELFVYKFYILKRNILRDQVPSNNTCIFMPWMTFHGTFQRFIAQDGKYLFHKPIIQFVIVLDVETKQQQPFMLIKKYLSLG